MHALIHMIQNAAEYADQLELSQHYWWEYKMVQPFGKGLVVSENGEHILTV